MRVRVHWGVGVAIVYGLFAAATVAFVIFAVAHPAALVSRDYYREATRHDERMTAAANGHQAGIAVTIEHTRSGDPIALLRFDRSYPGVTGSVTWYRPSDAAFDRVLPLNLDEEGRQALPLDGLRPGRWILKVTAHMGATTLYAECDVTVPR